ncbi:hypothetical protein PAEPH01_1906 [Pancytospora epiphaga]|nr:hypothetical protein PAEPH01_1906 [Pancytospora epiphaga]
MIFYKMAPDTILYQSLTLTFKETKAAICMFKEYFIIASFVDLKSKVSLALKSADWDAGKWLKVNNLYSEDWEKLTSLVCEESYDRAFSLCMQAAWITGKKIPGGEIYCFNCKKWWNCI